jgi:hypothetical protein
MHRIKLNAAREVWQNLTPTNPTLSASAASLETKRRHTLENRDKDLLVVQDLEMKLGVTSRWLPDCQEWQMAAVMAGKCRYQRCLDDLEGLIVSRMFELTKMNMSQTGEYIFFCTFHQLTKVFCRVQTSETYSYSSASSFSSNSWFPG